MPSRPRTSVLMPAYNAETTIRESVLSALNQSVDQLEIIVVDDGSRVPVAEVLGDIADSRLRILRHESNREVSAARNTGLASARGSLVSQLDADDVWEPDYVEAILPCFDDPSVGLAYSNASILGHPTRRPYYLRNTWTHPIDRFPALSERNPVPALTATMRTEAVRAVGGYARWIWGCEDYHLYVKLARAGWRFAFVDRPLARYRWPEPSRGRSYDKRRLDRNHLKLWVAFGLRHPLTPGPWRQVRSYLGSLG